MSTWSHPSPIGKDLETPLAQLLHAVRTVLTEATLHDQGGRILVVLPHRVWLNLEQCLDAYDRSTHELQDHPLQPA